MDTATPATAVAVWAPDGTAVERRDDPAPGERPGHAARLLALVDEVVPDWAAIERIAVGVGPGGFTGLRIGIATARALAQARDLPLVGVSSLAALAAPHDGRVVAVIDARRGEVFAALFEGDTEVWPPLAASPADLVTRLREDGFAPLAAGDGSLRFRGMLHEAGIRMAPEDSTAHLVHAFHVCRLVAGAEPAVPASIEPIYLRRPDAELWRERDRGAGESG